MGITVCERTVSVLMTEAGLYWLPGSAGVRRLRGVVSGNDLVNRNFHRPQLPVDTEGIRVALDFTNPQALAAIEEIKQLKARYCYCIDHKDWDQWVSLFAPDCRVDLGAWPVARHPVTNERIPVPAFTFEELEAMADGAGWPAVGREALRAVGSTTATNNVTVHHLFVPQIEIESESTARATWPMEDFAWWPEGSPQRRMHGFGYYRETYQRLEDARWYIETSQFSRSWIEWQR